MGWMNRFGAWVHQYLACFITLMLGWLAVAPLLAQAQTPKHLKYLGHYRSRGNIDEFQDAAIVGVVTGLFIVEREAVKSGIVESPFNKYSINRTLPSNLDGAPLEKQWAPKFQAVHLGFFGSFCPACAWKSSSIAADITASLWKPFKWYQPQAVRKANIDSQKPGLVFPFAT